MISQEIVCMVRDSSTEQLEEMEQRIRETGFIRFRLHWDTWKGISVFPPLDDVPWIEDEFSKIWRILEEDPNVLGVDTPEQGLTGQARSIA